MPTEEVFSAPDFRRIDGVVKSTKPLSYAGNIIDGMTFRFENGQVTEVTAEKGEETIRRLGRRKRRRTQPRRSRLGSGSVSDFAIRHRLLQHPVRRKCFEPLGAGLRLRIECCWRYGNDPRRAGRSRPEPFNYARGLHDRVRGYEYRWNPQGRIRYADLPQWGLGVLRVIVSLIGWPPGDGRLFVLCGGLQAARC